MPDLSFQVEGVEVVANAATPLLAFKLRLSDANPEQTIHTVALRCQIQLEVTRRKYTAEDQERLARSVWRTQPLGPDPAKSFVDARQSGRAFVHREQPWSIFPCRVRSISMWLPPNISTGWRTGKCRFACSSAAPFSMPVREGSLQVAPISWDKEARFKLPVKIWRDMMESYYPNSAWLCLHKDAFDRLYQYKVTHGIPTWEEVLESIIPGGRDGGLMNLGAVEQIAKAVLYEGYMLYPYRPSSVKNQQRWNFGVLCPQSYSEAQKGSEAWTMQTECLVEGSSMTGLEVRVRFLQLVARTVGELTMPVNELSPSEVPEFRLVDRLAVERSRLPALAGSGRTRSRFAGVQRGGAGLQAGA